MRGVAQPADVVEIFLERGQVVACALADPAVAAAWDRPSVLEDQRVSGLAGHLARGGVWVVADYLGAARPEGPVTFASAGEYFTTLRGDRRAICDRGADVAAAGHVELRRVLAARLDALATRLRSLSGDHLLAVTVAVVRALYRKGCAEPLLPVL